MESAAQDRAPRYLQLGRAIAAQNRHRHAACWVKVAVGEIVEFGARGQHLDCLAGVPVAGDQGLIEPHPRRDSMRVSRKPLVPEPELTRAPIRADQGRGDADAGRRSCARPWTGKVSLGASAPSPQLFPTTKLNQIIRHVIQEPARP